MALQSSGAISLNDIHVEAGGTSGTQASINDSDIRGLINKASGASMSFSEWYGASSGWSLVQGESGTSIDGFSQGFGSNSATYGSLTPDTLNSAEILALYYFEYVIKGSYTRQIYMVLDGNRAQNFFSTIQEASFPYGYLSTSVVNRSYNSQYDYTSYYWNMSARPSNWDGSGTLTINFT